MDAVKYFRAKDEMLKDFQSCVNDCKNCKYFGFCNGKLSQEEDIAIVNQWSKEQPIITYKEKFLEILPNVRLDPYGSPEICLITLGWIEKCPLLGNYESCWNREYEELG